MSSTWSCAMTRFEYGGVALVGGRLAGVAVSAQVGSHHVEARGERGRHAVPDRMGLRVSVQQQDRRRIPARPDDGVDVDSLQRNESSGETGEERHPAMLNRPWRRRS